MRQDMKIRRRGDKETSRQVNKEPRIQADKKQEGKDLRRYGDKTRR